MNKACRGFSYIELIACVAIVFLLLTIGLQVVEKTVQRAREAELRRSLLEIRRAIDQYKIAADAGRIHLDAGASGYPPNLNILAAGVIDRASSSEGKMYFIRRISRDPMHSGDANDNASTWGLRSYASSADNPKPGEDVYDVYSTSGGIGLNGIPYRDW